MGQPAKTSTSNFDQRETDVFINHTVTDPIVFNEARRECLSGAILKWENPENGRLDSTKLCLAVLEKSADVQRAPEDDRDLKRRGLLGLYEGILGQKGLPSNVAQARRLVETINAVSLAPEVRNSENTVTFQLSDKQNVPFNTFPAASLDAAFTSTVLQNYQTGKMPAPSNMSDATLDDVTRACFHNAQTNGACHDAGVAQAGKYLRKAKTAMGY
ncbi:hypothetical protein FBZ90_12636 [Nitrospirillum pindoramense]|uniref:Uncharacterized protein n=2 Tax=Nitrospirillum amazonense TaxID=28077 RepID=A0A560GK68_9PROT|nr:hypothetical protein FBZ90_12636 [Nitrospirillum amazonense]